MKIFVELTRFAATADRAALHDHLFCAGDCRQDANRGVRATRHRASVRPGP